jgi:hypothetical protein
MDIIFLGTTGVHHALVAAHIYLENLPDEKYYNLHNYANLALEAEGAPIYIGRDKPGNRVYSLGGGKDLKMAKKSIEDLTALLGYSSRDLLVQTITIPGDKLLAILCGIPPVLGGSLWSELIAAVLLKSQLPDIRQKLKTILMQQ